MNHSRRPRAAVAACASIVAVMAAMQGSPAMADSPPRAADPGGKVQVIVRAGDHQLACALAEARTLGAKIVSRQLGLGTFVARLRQDAAASLRTAPCVTAITVDRSVRLTASSWADTASPRSLAREAELSGASTYWQAGYTGEGIGVALLDSGVVPVDGLTGDGKLALGPDLSFESQDPATASLDTFGHGTHMAGIIAGKDTDATAPYTDAGKFTGVAPDAHLVSIKLSDRHGATDVSQVIAAIDWVVQHRDDPGMNIRVLNLSFGTDSKQDYRLDPLSYAAEVAWNNGIVVVVAAGNAGNGAGRGLTDPAYNPRLLAVGALDDKGTADPSDDVVPSFSSKGKGGTYSRNPDLVAPGTSIESLRDPGSAADAGSPGGRVGDRMFKGSGTSQAAAFTSGAVALLLSQRPSLTPDQVKALLTGSARPLPSEKTESAGRGALDLDSAFGAATPRVVQRVGRSYGVGTLEGARGSNHVVLQGVTLTGEKDIFGRSFNAAVHALRARQATSWDGGSWNGSTWAGSTWAGSTWAGSTWAGSTWAGSTWAGTTWAGTTWAGSTWTGSTWTGSTWTGSTWAGSTWTGLGWNSSNWSSARWN